MISSKSLLRAALALLCGAFFSVAMGSQSEGEPARWSALSDTLFTHHTDPGPFRTHKRSLPRIAERRRPVIGRPGRRRPKVAVFEHCRPLRVVTTADGNSGRCPGLH